MLTLLCYARFKSFRYSGHPMSIDLKGNQNVALFANGYETRSDISIIAKNGDRLDLYEGRSFYIRNVTKLVLNCTNCKEIERTEGTQKEEEENIVISYWEIPEHICQGQNYFLSDSRTTTKTSLKYADVICLDNEIIFGEETNESQKEKCIFVAHGNYRSLLFYGIEDGESYVIKSNGEIVECREKKCTHFNDNEPYFIRFVGKMKKENKIHLNIIPANTTKTFKDFYVESPHGAQRSTNHNDLNSNGASQIKVKSKSTRKSHHKKKKNGLLEGLLTALAVVLLIIIYICNKIKKWCSKLCKKCSRGCRKGKCNCCESGSESSNYISKESILVDIDGNCTPREEIQAPTPAVQYPKSYPGPVDCAGAPSAESSIGSSQAPKTANSGEVIYKTPYADPGPSIGNIPYDQSALAVTNPDDDW